MGIKELQTKLDELCKVRDLLYKHGLTDGLAEVESEIDEVGKELNAQAEAAYQWECYEEWTASGGCWD